LEASAGLLPVDPLQFNMVAVPAVVGEESRANWLPLPGMA
jgi:hypothetical protein